MMDMTDLLPLPNDDTPAEDHARLQDLLDRVCDQVITAEEIAELDTLLTADKNAREHYVRHIALHSVLQSGAALQTEYIAEDGDACSLADDSQSRRRIRLMTWGPWVAATLVFVLLGTVLFWSRVKEGRQPAPNVRTDIARSKLNSLPVARVTQLSNDIGWQNPNESIALMSHVSDGQTLKIARGDILLTYDSGAELRLLAPAEFVVGAAGGNLQRGGLRAIVPEKGRGFTITTPNGKVIDLGTEFGVAVDDFGLSEVSVFQGMVDMVPSLAGLNSDAIRLTQGEAVQWNGATLVRLKADHMQFGNHVAPLDGSVSAETPVISEKLPHGVFDTANWRKQGDVQTVGESLVLRGPAGVGELPYLFTTKEFSPGQGPVTVVCDIRFIEFDRQHGPSFSLLTRSANVADLDAPENWRTTRTCMRCTFKSPDASSPGVVEAAMKLDRNCPISNIQWRGFDRLEKGIPYRLVMTDDGINVTFTVSLRDNPSINKTVTCRSLFRGKENFVVLEGPVAGSVAVERVQVYHNTAHRLSRSKSRESNAAPEMTAGHESVAEVLASMAPHDGSLIIHDDFEQDTLNEALWRTLDEVAVVHGRVRLGKTNADEHINTYSSRPYLLTREQFTPADGTLTILGTIEFETNFLNEYGGSFAVMTRAADQRGNGPGWEYSVLRHGVRSNFWPAAWGQQHSLEVHEKPSPTSLSLLVAEGLEINPESREYYFKVVDDGENVALTLQDVQDASISKTVSVKTSSSLQRGFVGFEACWGCPVWLDNVRIYRTSR